MIRCARCSALVALQDATRCGQHDTEPLCGFCWKHHLETSCTSFSQCWGELGCLDWR